MRRQNPKTWGESRGRLHRLWSEGSWRLCPQAQAVHWSKPSNWIARCYLLPNCILPHRSKVSMPCLKNSWSVCREFTSMMSITMVRLYSHTNANRLFTVHCSFSVFCDFQTVFSKEVLLSYQISSKKFLPHSPPAVFHLPVKSYLKSKAGNIEILRSHLFSKGLKS